MQFFKKYFAQIIVLTFIFGYFSIYFGDVFLSPNSLLLSSDGDGIKNYYTFAHQIRHTGTSLHFSGMNYPYGEHVMYTDGMPLLGFICGLLPFLKGYEVGIFHYFLFISLAVGALLWLKIFRLLNVGYWLSIAGAISIIVMSPQMYRINGHFALSLIWILAAMFYFLIKWHQTDRKTRMTLYLAITIFCSFFFHAYLGLMSFLFVASALFFFWIWRKTNFKTFIISLGISTSGILLFLLFLKLTDLHSGRTSAPNGLFENYGYLETTFVPVFSPFKSLLSFFFPILHDQPWEAWAYIGILTLVVLILGMIIRLVQKIRRKSSLLIVVNDPMPPIFAACILLLLFSYLLPLKWFTEEFIYSIKIFNQFRALGRFGWVFYYGAQLYAIVMLSRMLANKKTLQIIFSVLIPILAVLESHKMHEWIFAPHKIGPNLLNAEVLKQDKDLSKVIAIMKREENAVILPLPYFHVGSERMNLDASNNIKKLAFISSFHTGYPLLASLLSRTSVSETKDILQIFNAGFGIQAPKELLQKKIWIICNNEEMFDNQRELLEYGTKKYASPNMSLYLLDYSKFFLEKYRNYTTRLKKTTESKLVQNGFQLSDSTLLIVDDFENEKSNAVFAGKGAKTVPRDQYSTLAEFPSPGEKQMDASFWYYMGEDVNYSGLVVVEEVDTSSGKGTWMLQRDLNQFTVFDGDWELVQIDFKTRKGPYSYKVFLVGSFQNERTFTYDNLLVREKSVDVLTDSLSFVRIGKKSVRRRLFNNFPIE